MVEFVLRINCSKSRLSWRIPKLKRTNKVTNNVLCTLKLSNNQGTAIVYLRKLMCIQQVSIL